MILFVFIFLFWSHIRIDSSSNPVFSYTLLGRFESELLDKRLKKLNTSSHSNPNDWFDLPSLDQSFYILIKIFCDLRPSNSLFPYMPRFDAIYTGTTNGPICISRVCICISTIQVCINLSSTCGYVAINLDYIWVE